MDEKQVLEVVELGEATELTKGLIASMYIDGQPPPNHRGFPDS